METETEKEIKYLFHRVKQIFILIKAIFKALPGTIKVMFELWEDMIRWDKFYRELKKSIKEK